MCEQSKLDKNLCQRNDVLWLKKEGVAWGISPWLGLSALADVQADTWIASFGPLLWTSKQPEVVAVNTQ